MKAAVTGKSPGTSAGGIPSAIRRRISDDEYGIGEISRKRMRNPFGKTGISPPLRRKIKKSVIRLKSSGSFQRGKSGKISSPPIQVTAAPGKRPRIQRIVSTEYDGAPRLISLRSISAGKQGTSFNASSSIRNRREAETEPGCLNGESAAGTKKKRSKRPRRYASCATVKCP